MLAEVRVQAVVIFVVGLSRAGQRGNGRFDAGFDRGRWSNYRFAGGDARCLRGNRAGLGLRQQLLGPAFIMGVATGAELAKQLLLGFGCAFHGEEVAR